MISSRQVYEGILDPSFLNNLDPKKRTPVYTERLNDSDVDCFVSLDRKTEQIIGFADYGPSRNQEMPSESELYSIYCLPEYQNRGIGKMRIAEDGSPLQVIGYGGPIKLQICVRLCMPGNSLDHSINWLGLFLKTLDDFQSSVFLHLCSCGRYVL